ncbi:MAG: hypothetical protein K2X86_02780 [Cytophagaceae bacterium]|nr:hypothetical protein [Cytophagaceae bacterium]
MEIPEKKLEKLLLEELVLRRKLTYLKLTCEKNLVFKEKLRQEIEGMDLQIEAKNMSLDYTYDEF